MKKCTQKNCRKMFLEAIFFAFEKFFFQSFGTKFLSLLYMISLAYKIFSLSFCQSLSRITMRNLHWCYTFCTGATLFALVLHLNYTALSQSESSNFFVYYYTCNNAWLICELWGTSNLAVVRDFFLHISKLTVKRRKTQKIQGYLILFIYFLFSTIKGYVKPQVLLQALEPIMSDRLPL